MGTDNEFEPLLGDKVPAGYRRPPRKGPVIKDQLVRMHSPIKVEIDETGFEGNGSESIEPLVEDGVVVGVVHRCCCGKAVEIQFEYEEPKKATSEPAGSATDSQNGNAR